LKKFSFLFVIIFILSIAVSVFAVPLDQQLKLDVIDRFDALVARDGEGWNQWKAGTKTDYNFDLCNLTYSIVFLIQEENETHIVIVFGISIVGFALDESNIKKRVVSERIMAAVYTKGRVFLGFKKLQDKPNIVLQGWNGKDI